MKKIFIGIYYFLTAIGFVLFLFVVSLGLVSFSYFNHQLNTKEKGNKLDVYLNHDVKNFVSYGEKEIVIEIEFYENKSESYLKMYALYYYDSYNRKIHMLLLKEKIIIIVNNSQEIIVNNYN